MFVKSYTSYNRLFKVMFVGVPDRVMYARNQQKVLGRVPVVGGQPINEEMAVVSIFPLLYRYYVTYYSFL